MILGIDVGGTHTDSVLMQNRTVIRKSKVPTDTSNILNCVLQATHAVAKPEDLKQLKRIVLSTTISTNAVAQNQLDPVGLIVMNGPGVSPKDLPLADKTTIVSGYMNHRGIEAEPLDADELDAIKAALDQQNIGNIAIVGKFSSRNPAHEKSVASLFVDKATHISLGHRLSGQLNFPRRIATTYLNESIWNLHSRLVEQLADYQREIGVDVPLYILKADGGTIEVQQSRHSPVQTILSGPAATIMGVLPFVPTEVDSVSIDVGGTTTDIALYANGAPLLEPQGVEIAGYKTLIRGLLTHSMALGGDSEIKVTGGQLQIGPERKGNAMALDGPMPTPTDAMIVLGRARFGSPEKARDAMALLGRQIGLSAEQTASAVMAQMCEAIAAKVRTMIDEINGKPVYTIHELLEARQLAPAQLIAVGGPAPYLAAQVGELLALPAVVPDHSDVINASGAAMARTTVELNLSADTDAGLMSIAEEGALMEIPHQFTVDDVIEVGKETLLRIANEAGARPEDREVEVTDSQSFNIVRGFSTTGKNIRVRLQIKPGLIRHEPTGEC